MKTGLLESLRKYRLRPEKDSLENFITEAFAWILKSYSDFSEYFLDWLMKKLNMQLPEIDKKDCEWTTQYNFDGVFPDMVCLSNKNAIVFEHKTWSHLSKNQLQNYKDYAAKNFVDSKVVLITVNRSQHFQNPDLALCWYEIYNLISGWLDRNTDASFIFTDFLNLLKSEGMGPAAPISHESIMYYYTTVNLKQNIAELIKRVEHEDWSLYIGEGYKKFIPKGGRGYEYSETSGRMGLNLLGEVESWRPGIFVGILLDGTDHCTKIMDLAKGPDFCLIFGFKEDLHDEYPSNKYYIEMVSNLSIKVASLNRGWQFYNHLDDDEIKKRNKWHPIHIRKPMLDVFVGTSTVEEQAKRFYETANELIKIVTDEDCFWKLRDNYRM